MNDIEHYPWLTVEGDGRLDADMRGTTPAEMDRRMVIMQELQAGRLVLASDYRGAVEALRMLADLHHRATTVDPRHDPGNRDWTECDCASCQLAQAIVGRPSHE